VRLIRADDAAHAARLAAAEIAACCRTAVATRGRALIALSGGETPWLMLRELRGLELPWTSTYVAQVDERVAPRGDPQRNLTRLEQALVTEGPLPRDHLLAMPVEAPDLAAASAAYQHTLEALAGRPLRLDLVQLGLGADGHTASLVPGDPVLDVRDRDVALSREYRGSTRMTLTLPALARAVTRLWLVTGAGKAERLRELLDGAGDTPAVAVPRAASLVLADAAAAGRVRAAQDCCSTNPSGAGPS
jgi:6-phosphogluconolactonase